MDARTMLSKKKIELEKTLSLVILCPLQLAHASFEASLQSPRRIIAGWTTRRPPCGRASSGKRPKLLAYAQVRAVVVRRVRLGLASSGLDSGFETCELDVLGGRCVSAISRQSPSSCRFATHGSRTRRRLPSLSSRRSKRPSMLVSWGLRVP